MKPIPPNWETRIVPVRMHKDIHLETEQPEGGGWHLWAIAVEPGWSSDEETYRGGAILVWSRPKPCERGKPPPTKSPGDPPSRAVEED